MRIAYDGTTLKHPQTGIGFYTEHLLHELATQPELEIFLLSNGPVRTSLPLSRQVVRVKSCRFPFRSVWLQLLAPFVLRRVKAGLAHFTNSVAPILSPLPTVVTLHDMTLELFPRLHPRKRQMTRPLVHLSARRARKVITVSENSKRDIMRLLAIESGRIEVIPAAPSPSFQPCIAEDRLQEVRNRYQLEGDFALFVGTLEPRKNIPLLVRSLGEVQRRGFPAFKLVCAGDFGWGSEQVRRVLEEYRMEHSVRLLGYVPFGDLPILYSLATVFVYPSLYEGFGLPVVEAMACGAPVIASRNSSLGEIQGGAIEWIDPTDPESLTAALIRVLSDSSLRREMSRRGLRAVRAYSWEEAARRTAAVYRKVAFG